MERAMKASPEYCAIGLKMARLAPCQDDLGKVLGVTQPTVSRKLRGGFKVTVPEVEKMAQAFDVPAIYFFLPNEIGPNEARAIARQIKLKYEVGK